MAGLPVVCRGFVRNQRGPTACARVPADIVKLPDPSIYTQAFELSLGHTPTWDNPDITSHQGSEPEPVITATIRNLSDDASAANVGIEFSSSAFGIGLPRTILGTVPVNLARASLPGANAMAIFPTPPALLEMKRFAVFVRVVHPYDKNPNNNEGHQCLSHAFTMSGTVATAIVPVTHPLDTPQNVTMHFTPGLGITITPSNFALQPNQTLDVSVAVNVPPGGFPKGTAFDVWATTDTALFGGVWLSPG